MKKLIILVCFVLTLSFTMGCSLLNGDTADTTAPGNTTAAGSTAANTSAPLSDNLNIEDYFPMKENVKYVYEGKGNEFAAYTLINDYTAAKKVQQRIDNGGSEVLRVIEIFDGKLVLLVSKGETYYRENFLSKKYPDGEVLLMEPLQKGTTWTLKDSRVRTVTNTEAAVTTPSGSYKAIEVTTKGTGDKTVDYYVKDLGLVKTVFSSGETEVSSTLSKIEENAALTQRINFYYPNINDEKIYFETKEISFKTNDTTKIKLEKAYKELMNANYGSVLSTNTKINSLYLNTDNMVYLDLSSAFLDEMNAGANYEKMILQSIANTFGQYYSSDKVILTVDNKLYESGHIAMKKGQSLKVDTEGTIEMKK